MKKRPLLVATVLVCTIAALALWRLADHDLGQRNAEPLVFRSGDAQIAGTVWLPDATPTAAIVLVHGDGAQDRTSAGGYAPFINTLLDRGIAVASWDKPGVGASSGNWLHQSMPDRADETRAAISALQNRFPALVVGALGFSQAGWVLPKLTEDDVAFLVLIGPAVSWRDQGIHYTEMRLIREGVPEAERANLIAEQQRQNMHRFGPDATFSAAPDGMSSDRWRFIKENRDADASPDLARLNMPFLAIWGQDDLNVDAANDAQIYTALALGRHPANTVVLWPDATHGLLRADHYNWQLVSQWPWHAQLRFLVAGRGAFAPGSLDAIADWVLARSTR